MNRIENKPFIRRALNLSLAISLVFSGSMTEEGNKVNASTRNTVESSAPSSLETSIGNGWTSLAEEIPFTNPAPDDGLVHTAEWQDPIIDFPAPIILGFETEAATSDDTPSIFYHLENDHIPHHEGEHIAYDVEVRTFKSDDYPILAREYGPGKIIKSFWLTNDGKPFNAEDSSQYGVAIYVDEEDIPDGDLTKLLLNHAKTLYPQAVDTLLDVSGFKLQHQYTFKGDPGRQYRTSSWIILSYDPSCYLSYALHTPEEEFDSLPSGNGWESCNYNTADDSRDIVLGSRLLEDVWAHEIYHGTSLAMGSQYTQEALAEVSLTTYTAVMESLGHVITDTYKTELNRSVFNLSKHLGKGIPSFPVSTPGLLPGELAPDMRYDANFILYVFYRNFDKLGIDPATAFDEDGYVKPDIMRTAFRHFVEGSFFVREYTTPEEYDSIMTKLLYGTRIDHYYRYAPSAQNDRSLILALESYELKSHGSTDWQQAVTIANETPNDPLQTTRNDYLFSLFRPNQEPITGPASRQFTQQLENNESLHQTNSPLQLDTAHITAQDLTVQIDLNKTLGSPYGYSLNKLYDLRSLQQSILPNQEIVLKTTNSSGLVKMAIRTPSGDFYAEISSENSTLRLPPSSEPYYLLILANQPPDYIPEIFEPLTISIQAKATEGTPAAAPTYPSATETPLATPTYIRPTETPTITPSPTSTSTSTPTPFPTATARFVPPTNTPPAPTALETVEAPPQPADKFITRLVQIFKSR